MSLKVTGRGKVFNPKIKFLPSGKAVCDFSIGTSRKGKDGKYVNSYFPAKAFGPIAESISEMEKTFVTLEGFMGQDEWDDKETGKKRRKEYVVVVNLIPVDAEPKDDSDVPF